MNHLKRILVCLDQSEMDAEILGFASIFAKNNFLEHIHFLHVIPSPDLPQKIQELYPNLSEPNGSVAKIKGELEELVNQKLVVKNKVSFDVAVRSGNLSDVILRWSHIKKTDLIIIGRKSEVNGTGALSRKLCLLATCSVLIIPEKVPHEIKKIFIPIDFSGHTQLLLQQAVSIQKDTGANILCKHVYTVPPRFHSTGKSYIEFAELMQMHAKELGESMIKQNQLDQDKVKLDISLDDDRNPAKLIASEVKKNQADLVMIGSKGSSMAASVLLGSIAARLISKIVTTPLLIIKQEGENGGFFKELMHL